MATSVDLNLLKDVRADSSSAERVFIVASVTVAAFLAVLFFSTTWQTGDDARYYGLAHALLNGHGYTWSYLPDRPPENLTPPGHVLLLTLAMGVFGLHPVVGKILGSLLYIAACGLVARWAWKASGGRIAEAGLAVCGMFTVGLMSMSTWYMAEMSFMVFSFSGLLAADQAGRDRTRLLAFIAGLLVGYAYWCRSVGLAIVAGGALFFAVRRELRLGALFVAGFVCLAAPWMIRNWIVAGSPDAYVPHFGSMTGGPDSGMNYPWMRVFGDIARAFPQYFGRDLPSALFFQLMDGKNLFARMHIEWLSPPVRYALLSLILTGWIVRLRRPQSAEFCWPSYWLLISAPPFPPQGNWYVYPMLPLAGLYLATGLTTLGRMLQQVVPRGDSMARIAIGVSAVYILATAFGAGIVHAHKEAKRRPFAPWAPERYFVYENEYYDAWARFVEAGQWIASNLPPNTLVASRQPQHIYLITGLQGWRYDLAQVPGTSLWDRLQWASKRGPVALIQDAFKAYEGATFSYGVAHWALRELFQHHEADLVEIYRTEDPVTRVWTLKKSTTPERSRDL